MLKRSIVCLMVGLVLTGCGGDDGGGNGPANADVNGAWRMTFTNMSGSSISCATAFPVSFNQSGTTFTGSYGPGTVSCAGPGGSTSFDVQGVVVNGTVSGNRVAFDLDTQDAHQTGTLSGNSLSGTAAWRFDIGSGNIVSLNGNWSAARQ